MHDYLGARVFAEDQIVRLAEHAKQLIATAETYPTEAQTDETHVHEQH